MTIFLTPVPDPRAYGLVETAADGRLLRFREKPGPGEAIATNMINAGIYLIDAALLARIPTGRMVSIEREFFPAVIADGIPSFGWSAPAYWRDIGNPAAYHAAQIDLLGGRVKTSLAPAGESQRGSWVHPTASIGRRADRAAVRDRRRRLARARRRGGTLRRHRTRMRHRGGSPRAAGRALGGRAGG